MFGQFSALKRIMYHSLHLKVSKVEPFLVFFVLLGTQKQVNQKQSAGSYISNNKNELLKVLPSLIMFSSNKIFRFILYLNKGKKRLKVGLLFSKFTSMNIKAGTQKKKKIIQK